MPTPAKSDTSVELPRASAEERTQTAGTTGPGHEPPRHGGRRPSDVLRQPPHRSAEEGVEQAQQPRHHGGGRESDQLQQHSHHSGRRASEHHGVRREPDKAEHSSHSGARRVPEHHGSRRHSDQHPSQRDARRLHDQHGGRPESDTLQQPLHGVRRVSHENQQQARHPSEGPRRYSHYNVRRVSNEAPNQHRPRRTRSLPTILDSSARSGVVNGSYARLSSMTLFMPADQVAASRISLMQAAAMEPERRISVAPAVAAAAMAVKTPMASRRSSQRSTLLQHPLVPLFNFLMCTMCVLVVVAVLFLLLMAYLDRINVHPTTTCTSHACREYAQLLLASLNHSVDPCHSFTHFVCDGWRKRHVFSVHERAFGATIERIVRIVEIIDVPRSGQSMLQRAAMLFRSCTALLKRQRDELADVKTALRHAGVSWPHHPPPAERRDLLRMMLHCDYALGWSAVFRVDPEQHVNETRTYLLTDSAFNFIVRKHNERTSQPGRQQYFTVLRNSFRDTNKGKVAGDVNLVTFEETMSLESRMLEPLLSKVYTKAYRPSALPPRVVYSTAANLSAGRWRAALENEGVEVQQRLTFHTWHLPFFATFVDLWELHGEEEMYAYVSWCTVQVAALFANADLIENFYGHKQRATIFHGAFCLSRAYIGAGKPLLTSYASEVLPQSTRSGAESLTLAVRSAFLGRLSAWAEYKEPVGVFRMWDSNWMAFSIFEPNPKTMFDVIVGEMGDSFLRNWRNAWLSRTGFRNIDITVATMAIETLAFSADVEYRKDFILLPYAFCFPHYDADAILAINYGGFGSKVALAAGERFYSAYRRAGAGGSSFNEFQLCLTNDSFGSDWGDEASLFAEVVSLGALVDAYRNASDNRRLTLLERLTGEQLLFIASCYTKCTGSYYPVSESVCDAVLQHVPEFAEAFSCASGTPMNPQRRCQLF